MAKRVALITGGMGGLGETISTKMADAGYDVAVTYSPANRTSEAWLGEMKAKGYDFRAHSCDVADFDSCAACAVAVEKDLGPVDILVNNAGRSIRRSIALSYDRFHDFERTMQLNYFGSLRLIMGFLPGMSERKKGHIINISSIGVLSNAPRFSAYVASKAALDAFSRCAASEFSDRNIHFTIINMPLVRTPMIGPTKMYDNVPTLTPEDAADLVVRAVIERPQRIATRVGIFAEILHLLAPKVYQVVLNTAFQLFPDSAAAKGVKPGQEAPPSSEQVAFASMMRGIHW